MREHLVACTNCRAYYESHLVLAELDPGIRSAEDRIAAGLGLRVTRPRSVGVPLFGGLSAAVVVLVFLIAVPWSRVASPDEAPRDVVPQPAKPAEPGAMASLAASSAAGFSARGSKAERLPAGLLVYRVPSEGEPERVADRIRIDDELAFAYTNAGGWKYLLVFGVDEHGHVYWYYPAWIDPDENPVALPIAPGGGVRELPDAVQHRLVGARVRVVGLFTNHPLRVRDVEEQLERANVGGTERTPAAEPFPDTELFPDSLRREFIVNVEHP